MFSLLRRSVILMWGTVNRPGKRVSAEKGKHRLGPEKTSTRNPTKRALIKQKKINS